MTDELRVCVVGAGLFGCMTALKLAAKGFAVDLLDVAPEILEGASRHNQNRIHLGCHYLRSIETAQECVEGLISFSKIFQRAIRWNFPNYYGIAARGSKSTPERFEEVCGIAKIDFRAEFPSPSILRRDMVTQCYRVNEPIFDYFVIKEIVGELLRCSSVRLFLSTELRGLDRRRYWTATTSTFAQEYDVIVNATYSALNRVNEMAGAPKQTYLYEDVVIPIFRYPAPSFGVTVMDGEFCSVMPRGFRPNEFLLYHVKHSVLTHRIGQEGPTEKVRLPDDTALFEASSVFMPFLASQRAFDRYQCIRCVRENADDSRRSMIQGCAPDFWWIFSGKVTTCVDVAARLADCIAQSKGHDAR